MKISRRMLLGSLALALLGAGGCRCCASGPAAPFRVGSYNIRLAPGDRKTANDWDLRKRDLVDLIRKMELDAFGLQEVCPDQAQYLREQLPEFAFVGDHRGADRTSDEASPVFYRKARFTALKSGTFWLSETPDVPGVKGWGAACPRVCSWMWLKDRTTGRTFCFANTHTDHVSARARKEGMLLIIRRMKEFAGDVPIVFTGDHNCRENEEPARAVARLLDNALLTTQTPPRGPWRTFNGWTYRADECPAAHALKLPVDLRNARKGSPDADRDARGRHRWEDCGPRIDYIYVTPGVKVFDYETRNDVRPGTRLYPSDHFPVAATIELR
ncbi:MAG: endonuclease/exonuclease/phosphatase family protein [Kiritimatiellia bacterium]